MSSFSPQSDYLVSGHHQHRPLITGLSYQPAFERTVNSKLSAASPYDQLIDFNHCTRLVFISIYLHWYICGYIYTFICSLQNAVPRSLLKLPSGYLIHLEQ